MKNWFINNFGFSKREYNGLLMLLVLVLILAVTPSVYRNYVLSFERLTNNERLAIQKLIIVDRYARKNYSAYNDISEEGVSTTKVQPSYHTFNPNTITAEEWQRFGLSLKQAMSIVNYVKKGGHFYKPEDLQKMYTISPKKYQELLPYVNIPQLAKQENKSLFTYAKKAPVMVDVNTADTLMLDEIKGVGAAFARRIVKYRERLGGFYAKEQLLEVFGVDTAKFIEIKDQIKIDPEAIKKIPINSVEFDDLKRHPYLTFKQMNAIVQYRKQHGAYKNLSDLGKVLILKPETIDKIAPYLDFRY
ncbi:ComEA family DNA-binding protein [Pedobacter sp.]